MPPTKLTSSKRFLVRVSLVTGSTLATIIGAQSLAALNNQDTNTTPPTAPRSSPLGLTNQVMPTLALTPGATAVHAAPSITILRRPGQTNAQNANSTNGGLQPQSAGIVIAPPVPVQIALPEPVVVEAPAAPIVVVPGAAAAAAASTVPAVPAPTPPPATKSSR
jgi:hypothetical protein